MMLEQLKPYKARYEQILSEVCKPEIFEDMEKYRTLTKEQSDLLAYAELYDEYAALIEKLNQARKMAEEETDPEFKAMAEAEASAYEAQIPEFDKRVQLLLLPKDKNDDSNVYIEVRGGAGGDEASLFAAELFNMYQRYAESRHWTTEIQDYNSTEVGGLREGVLKIMGKGAYKRLKFESGVHRVQRVPETEAQGRVHTSTVTVAVLPEVETVDFEISEKDLRVDVYRSSSAGGQGVNTTDSAVRLTHLPTGIVVTCQDARSQIKNKERAMQVLKAKLQDYYQQKIDQEHAAERKMQVGTGDRSERIRTYNFPQGRVTDHRIGLSQYNIDEFMQGDIDSMLDALHTADQELKLQNL